MGSNTTVIEQAYAAFGRGDIPSLLAVVADPVDWEFVAPASLPFAGRRRSPQEVADFFAVLAGFLDIQYFEPSEFIDGGLYVTVLGAERGVVRHSQRPFETEWAHVATVVDGKITRWRGFADTAVLFI